VSAETHIPRLRMFAGPNGSGKSTLYRRLQTLVDRPDIFGVYLNADDIESRIRADGSIKLQDYGVEGHASDLLPFFHESSFLRTHGLAEETRRFTLSAGPTLHFNGVAPTSYHASVLVDYLRRHLLARRMDFTFETVMSSPDKVAFLSAARAAGYRTYLYYVATDDPIINVSRVRSRVSLGGHTVPETKIIERYNRSLALLRAAVASTSRAYIFDNSGNEQEHVWLAEITEGRTMEIKSDRVPAWLTSSLLSS
jgi:predicted ABC-type ATPase